MRTRPMLLFTGLVPRKTMTSFRVPKLMVARRMCVKRTSPKLAARKSAKRGCFVSGPAIGVCETRKINALRWTVPRAREAAEMPAQTGPSAVHL